MDDQLLTNATPSGRAYRPPMGVTPTWQAVMDRAGHQCQCTGACGNLHSKTGRRCSTENGFYVKGVRGPVHLAAAPADLTVQTEHAVRLAVAELRAWCPNCYSKARARARATDAATAPQPDALF